jgi:hypothetical protein
MDKSLQNREVLNTYRLITSYLLHTSFFKTSFVRSRGAKHGGANMFILTKFISTP